MTIISKIYVTKKDKNKSLRPCPDFVAVSEHSLAPMAVVGWILSVFLGTVYLSYDAVGMVH